MQMAFIVLEYVHMCMDAVGVGIGSLQCMSYYRSDLSCLQNPIPEILLHHGEPGVGSQATYKLSLKQILRHVDPMGDVSSSQSQTRTFLFYIHAIYSFHFTLVRVGCQVRTMIAKIANILAVHNKYRQRSPIYRLL